MIHAIALFAQDAAKQGEGGNSLLTFLPLIAIGVLFYFLMIRPMRRQDQERQSMASNLRKNDRILTTSGIYGTVVATSDKEDEVTVKVDENVRLKMIKAGIARNLTREEEAKQQKEAPKEEKKEAEHKPRNPKLEIRNPKQERMPRIQDSRQNG